MQSSKNESFPGNSRVIGLLLLLSLFLPVLNWMLILSQFTPEEGNASLIILNNELLFRLGIIIGSAPVLLFQIIFGLWLLCRGIKRTSGRMISSYNVIN